MNNNMGVGGGINMADGSSDAVLVLGSQNEICFYNRSFITITGHRESYIASRDIDELFESESHFKLSEQLAIARGMQSTRQTELFLTHPAKWVQLSIYPVVDQLFITISDITLKKEQNESILLDEQNLRILINIIDHPVWLVDTNCKIVICNRPFKKWISYFIGKELDNGDYVLSDDMDNQYLDKFRTCYQLAISGKVINAVENMMVDKEMKFTTVTFNPVYDVNNVLTGISCHATDITDQRRNLSKLEIQTKMLMEIANIQSHKVRGPVSTLLGLVHIYNFNDVTDPSNIEVMEGIASVTKKLDDVIKDVIHKINRLGGSANTMVDKALNID